MNILIFGPNGSGKGTQGAVVQKKFSITHVESGALFRENIKGGTELGRKAKEYIDRGDLVPDGITIPMILDRLKKDDCKTGWLLDGFPRNPDQAEALEKALEEAGITLDYIIEISLDRDTARERIMGRRLCEKDNNHPNNVNIAEIKPAEKDGGIICGYAAVIFQCALMIRMREPLTNGMKFIMTRLTEQWQLLIILRSLLRTGR
jgi:adenylate kinase